MVEFAIAQAGFCGIATTSHANAEKPMRNTAPTNRFFLELADFISLKKFESAIYCPY